MCVFICMYARMSRCVLEWMLKSPLPDQNVNDSTMRDSFYSPFSSTYLAHCFSRFFNLSSPPKTKLSISSAILSGQHHHKEEYDEGKDSLREVVLILSRNPSLRALRWEAIKRH